MAKLEEISELLVSELRDFEETVKKLEEIQKAKITIDFAELKMVLLNHEVEIKKQSSAIQQVLKEFEKLFKEATIYPKWAVVIFIFSLVFNCIAIFYLILSNSDKVA